MTPKREWLDTDYYAVLGVDDDADLATIKKAYRRLAREHHPDANPDDSGAEQRFKEMGEAYAVLRDEDSRKEYDEIRRLGAAGLGGGVPGGFGGGFSSGGFGDSGDLSDLLRGMFEAGGARSGGQPFGGQPARPRKGRDYDAALSISFGDALAGVHTTMRINGDGPCETCGGSGAAPGTSPITCRTCGGTGQIAVDQGPFSFAQPCTTCGGTGTEITDPCPTCDATGRVVKPRQLTVAIPPGVKDGAVVRLRGRGAPGMNGGPAGDVLVHVSVDPHPQFGRKGDNVTITLPITYAQAVLGTRLDVPTPRGGTTAIRVPPGTTSGSTFRIPGEGADRSRGRGRGDLRVTVEIEVPTDPTGEQIELLERLDSLQATRS